MGARSRLMTDVGRSPPQTAAHVVDNHGVPTLPGTPETIAESRYAPRVVLADDDILLREGLASLLDRSGFDVVGQCGDAVCLIDLVRRERPDLVVVGIRMPPRHNVEGLEAARQIRAEFPGTAILVLSAHVEVEH